MCQGFFCLFLFSDGTVRTALMEKCGVTHLFVMRFNSGIGLARESLYISFLDPSYFPKLEEEFREHIPGFFGKQRSKAMKRQLDGNMLWRQLAEKKLPMGKKLKGMTPDERVQAMIDSGMI